MVKYIFDYCGLTIFHLAITFLRWGQDGDGNFGNGWQSNMFIKNFAIPPVLIWLISLTILMIKIKEYVDGALYFTVEFILAVFNLVLIIGFFILILAYKGTITIGAVLALVVCTLQLVVTIKNLLISQ